MNSFSDLVAQNAALDIGKRSLRFGGSDLVAWIILKDV